MLYSRIVKNLIRQSFDHVNHRRWDELLKAVAPNIHHRFAGAHAIGGGDLAVLAPDVCGSAGAGAYFELVRS